MKLRSVEIDNYRAIEHLHLPLDPSLTVLHGDNTCGKTSVLSAIAVGLGVIPRVFNVSGLDFLETDLRAGESFVQVEVTTTEDVGWKRERRDWQMTDRGLDAGLRGKLSEVTRADEDAGTPVELPIVAFYGTDRPALAPDVFKVPDRGPDRLALRNIFDSDVRRYAVLAAQEEMIARIGPSRDSARSAALKDALAARPSFPELFTWFYAKENDELREQKKRHNFDYRRRDLSAVREAISSMLDGVSDPRVEVDPLRFSVSVESTEGSPATLELDQLSGGQRAVLALAADLAWRMAQGNPHLDEPLGSEAIVLIDEVELHLHPSWQQRILNDLRRTFPNAQLIVSTHSPQVLTTVEPKHIVELAREDGRVVARSADGWTYGAESGDVLSVVMGVDQRPVNKFTEGLGRYRRLINDGKGESQEALALRQDLEKLSPHDPALDRADLEIRRRRVLRQMGKPT